MTDLIKRVRDGELVPRESITEIVSALAAIVNAPQTDRQLEAEVIPRGFVMDQVMRIREAVLPRAAPDHTAELLQALEDSKRLDALDKLVKTNKTYSGFRWEPKGDYDQGPGLLLDFTKTSARAAIDAAIAASEGVQGGE